MRHRFVPGLAFLTAAAVVLVAQQPADAASFTYASTTPVSKVSYLTSGTYSSKGGGGWALGGQSWDLVFKVGAINPSASYIAAATAPGTAHVTYQHGVANVRGRCYWNSSQPLGSRDVVPLTCSIDGIGAVGKSLPSGPEPELRALTRPAAPSDGLPEWVDLTVLGLEKASARHLGRTSSADYWTATSTNNETCLVIASVDGSEAAAASCTDAATFNEKGTALRFDSHGSIGDSSYLVPDNVRTTGRSVTTAPNLIVVPPAQSRASSRDTMLMTESGKPFKLVDLSG